MGLDRRVSDPDISAGSAPTPTRSSLTHCGPPSHSAPTKVVLYPPTHLLRAARGEGMDLGVPMSDAVAAILSRLVEVYIGLRMCTSIRAIIEHILLHCALTSEPGHHASRRWIVEKAMVAMHGAMQDGVSETLQRALFIALLLDACDRQRHRINEYAIVLLFPGTGPGGMCEVFLGVVDVASGEAQEVTAQVEAVLLSWMPDRAWWAHKGCGFCGGWCL